MNFQVFHGFDSTKFMHSPNLNYMNVKTVSQVLVELSPGPAAGPHLPPLQAGGQGGVDAAEVVLDAGALVGRPEVPGGRESSFMQVSLSSVST